ncbi:hypothetical protein S40288_03671 [Stachybotrys chartarum IBT 40288]|nr:hypothetical protein S40288_03671 [Stachybotrys chartarum IBT 40288]
MASPPIALSDLVFASASPSQRLSSWTLNGTSWAAPLSVPAYVARELTLSATALASHARSGYWVLHRRDDPEDVVAGCETTAKQLLVADAQGSRVVDAYAIASVFTDPKYRGLGLASFMLRELQGVVDGEAEAGALYSDIGRVFYTKLGWRDFRSPQVTITLDDGFTPPDAPSSGVKVRLLDEADVAALCDKDVAAVTQRFDALAQHADGRTHIAFLPTFTQMAWHFARDTYNARDMLSRSVTHRGAATADGASWLYWDHDVRERKLKILRVVTDPAASAEQRAADVVALVWAAVAEASDWGFPSVLAWSPGAEVCDAALAVWRGGAGKVVVRFDEREAGSIPSLRWREGRDVGDIVWEDNEYYAWC